MSTQAFGAKNEASSTSIATARFDAPVKLKYCECAPNRFGKLLASQLPRLVEKIEPLKLSSRLKPLTLFQKFWESVWPELTGPVGGAVTKTETAVDVLPWSLVSPL